MNRLKELKIEFVLTARLTYRGVEVEIKTDPGSFEDCRIKLLKLVEDTKGAIDYAAANQSATAKAGI